MRALRPRSCWRPRGRRRCCLVVALFALLGPGGARSSAAQEVRGTARSGCVHPHRPDGRPGVRRGGLPAPTCAAAPGRAWAQVEEPGVRDAPQGQGRLPRRAGHAAPDRGAARATPGPLALAGAPGPWRAPARRARAGRTPLPVLLGLLADKAFLVRRTRGPGARRSSATRRRPCPPARRGDRRRPADPRRGWPRSTAIGPSSLARAARGDGPGGPHRRAPAARPDAGRPAGAADRGRRDRPRHDRRRQRRTPLPAAMPSGTATTRASPRPPPRPSARPRPRPRPSTRSAGHARPGPPRRCGSPWPGRSARSATGRQPGSRRSSRRADHLDSRAVAGALLRLGGPAAGPRGLAVAVRRRGAGRARPARVPETGA